MWVTTRVPLMELYSSGTEKFNLDKENPKRNY